MTHVPHPEQAPNRVLHHVALTLGLAVAVFAGYVLWTWASGAHTTVAHDPLNPWVGIGAGVGLLLAGATIALEVSRHRHAGGTALALALLALAAASVLGLSWTKMRPTVALSFALLSLGLLALRIRPLRRAGMPAAFGVASLVVALSVVIYYLQWRMTNHAGLYLLLASPLTAALQAALSIAFLAVALRIADLRAFGRYPVLIATATLVGAAMIGSWAVVITSTGNHARDEAQQRVVNAVQVLTEHAHRSMDPADLLLQTLAERVREVGVERFAASHREWQHARSAVKKLKQLSALLIVDTRGRVVMYTEQYPAAIRGRFDNRDYFQAHQGGVDHFLGPLIRSGSGKLVFTLSRRLTDAQGRFLGVALASMEIDYFRQFYQTIDRAMDQSVALIRRDGRPLVRVPEVPDLDKMDLGRDVLFTRHLRAGPQGTFLSLSPFDGRQRLAAYRISDELPLVLVATVGSEPIASAVEDEFVYSAVLLSGALVILSAAFGNQVRSRERERRDRLVLARNHAFTRSVLDSMSASVAIIDIQGNIVDVNAQWNSFAQANDSPEPTFIGTNYLGVCDAASTGCPDAAAAAKGIRAVIDGQKMCFQMTYPCHSPAEERWIRMLVTPLSGGDHGAVISHENITELKLAEQKLERLARVDTLTGLSNRRDFDERIEEAMARSRRSKRPMGLVFLDVDHFKSINDTRGHHVGDEVLKEFARRVSGSIRITDRAFRLAGDEFVVILEGLNHGEEGGKVAEKIVGVVHQPMVIEGETLTVTTSVGVAYFAGRDGSAGELMERADRALYRAKAAGRDTFAETTF